MTRQRLDLALVRAGLARSRSHAAELVGEGRVLVDGAPASKAALAVVDSQRLAVAEGPDHVSRAGRKLAGALDVLAPLGLSVTDRIVLDAGASTGGFTQELLRRGATSVHAVDVGHDQLAPELRADPRVHVAEGVNVRHLAEGDLEPVPSLVVADLSFISLRLVLAPLAAVATPDAELLLLIKPQFEVGRERLGSGGVVRDERVRRAAVDAVLADAETLGWQLRDVRESVLPGPSGNVEYFAWWQATRGTP
ncbi:MAG: TlyA family RNA methyltransferase [Actinomycetota bacterium]|nr:TlyA family RNA methyltransferase [Actinomycetota bacterium]